MDTVTEPRSQGIYPHLCALIISFCCIFADGIALAAATIENTDENGEFWTSLYFDIDYLSRV